MFTYFRNLTSLKSLLHEVIIFVNRNVGIKVIIFLKVLYINIIKFFCYALMSERLGVFSH